MAKAKIDILSAIEATTLEWTAILNGYFLDYFVAPKVKSYMSPWHLFSTAPMTLLPFLDLAMCQSSFTIRST